MKVVITGRTASGKTTLINYLNEKGYDIIPEVAREVIKETPNLSPIQRQKLILERQHQREWSNDNGIWFSDRSLVDCIAYSQEMGVRVDEKYFRKLDYDLVCVLEPIQFVEDGVRWETEEEADKFMRRARNIYKSLGIKLIDIPIGTTKDRADRILGEVLP